MTGKWVLVLVPLLAGGCTTVEVVRLAPPETLVAPQDVPVLGGDTNEALVRLLGDMEHEIELCNMHKQLIQEFYDDN